MGLITYYSVARDEDDQAGEEVDIDKSALELAAALDGLGLDGSQLVMGGVASSEEDEDEEADGFGGTFLPAQEVAALWGQLEPVSFDALFAAFVRTELGSGAGAAEREYLEAHFATLKDVYQRAAAACQGLQIAFC